jgi:hypothetical protein
LYDFEDDGSFSQWLAAHPYSDDEAEVRFIDAIPLPDDLLGEDCPDLATLVDDIVENDVFHLEIDGTQLEDWDVVLKEDMVLPLPPNVRQTLSGLEVGSYAPSSL